MRVTVPQLAARYGVTPRTVFRWKRAGVDPLDFLAVGRHVGSNPRVPLRILETVAEAISAECERMDALPEPVIPNAFAAGVKSVLQPKT